MKKKFSILVVCLNPGDKLKQTIDSILMQTCEDYEIVIKDGGSSDGSAREVTALYKEKDFVRCFVQKDTGIYDAMNQAVALAEGEYVLFLNCGDTFASEAVLSETERYMGENPDRGIYYGDTFCEQTQTRVASPREITPFVCYRNIPCHQSCFYKKELFGKKPYDPSYKIRADYDHFLYCCLAEKVRPLFMDLVVANYEGGGYSESRANKKRDRQEHRQITQKYLTRRQLLKYKTIMALTLAPLRRFLAEKTAFSKIYNKIKAGIYR